MKNISCRFAKYTVKILSKIKIIHKLINLMTNFMHFLTNTNYRLKLSKYLPKIGKDLFRSDFAAKPDLSR